MQKKLTPYQQTVYELSERIVKAQQPIRVLDAIKWDASIQQDFFEHNCSRLPNITKEYYQKNSLPFDPEEKNAEFYHIEVQVLQGPAHRRRQIRALMPRDFRSGTLA